MKAERKNLLQRFLVWREKNIKEKRFILILSFLVGIFTALAALILKKLEEKESELMSKILG